MSDINHKVWCLANDYHGSKPCNCGAPSELPAPAGFGMGCDGVKSSETRTRHSQQ